MPTSFPMSDPWSDNVLINGAALYANTTTPMNDLAAATPNGFIGDATSGSSATFATAAADYASPATVAFTLTTQRRIRIFAKLNFAMLGGTNGLYTIAPAYYVTSAPVTLDGNRKITAGTYTGIVTAAVTLQTVVGASVPVSQMMEGSVLLAAGSYTAFAITRRSSGGGTTDTAGGSYVAVHDMGSS